MSEGRIQDVIPIDEADKTYLPFTILATDLFYALMLGHSEGIW